MSAPVPLIVGLFDAGELDDMHLLEVASVELAPRVRYGIEGQWWAYDGTTGLWSSSRDPGPAQRALAVWLEGHRKATERHLESPGHPRADRVRDAMNRGWPLSATKIKILTQALQAYPAIRVDGGVFDSLPLLHCTNGVLRITAEGAELLPHSPEHLCTKSTRTAYYADAVHEDWTKALQCQPEPDTARWMRAFFGSGCLPVQAADCLALLVGRAHNGKTTVMVGTNRALGDYSSILAPSLYTGDAASWEVATLQGVRFGWTEETDDTHTLRSAQIKRFLGSGSMTGAAKYRAPVTFPLQVTPVLSCNRLPTVPDLDNGTWRRLKVLNFPVAFVGALEDGGLRDRLMEGLDGRAEAVLAWLVAGAVDFLATGGLPPCRTVEEDTEAMRESMDVLGNFIQECVEPVDDHGALILRTDLREAFLAWMDQEGLSRMKPRWTARAFRVEWDSRETVQDAGMSIIVRGMQGRSERGDCIRFARWTAAGAALTAYRPI